MSNYDWKQDLTDIFDGVNAKVEAKNRQHNQQLSESIDFLLTVVKAAFEQLKAELEKYGREASIDVSDQFASIVVRYEGKVELDYSFRLHGN